MVKEDLRDLLKSYSLQELDNIETDQEKELPQPAVQKNLSRIIIIKLICVL